jgi:hypothetical protein
LTAHRIEVFLARVGGELPLREIDGAAPLRIRFETVGEKRRRFGGIRRELDSK